MCLCICQPPSIPNFQILLLSIVFKIYSHEAAKFNCYPTEDWYLMSWNSLYGSQVFVHNKVIIFVFMRIWGNWGTPLEGILRSHGLAWIKNIHYHHCHDPFFMLGYNRSSCPGLGQWASEVSSLELWISEFSVRKYGGKKSCALSQDHDKRSPSKWSLGKNTWGLNLHTKT